MISQLNFREKVAMLVRVVNFFALILCVKVCTLQGKNASVNEMDYSELRKLVDEQIPLFRNNRSERHVSLRKLIQRFDRSAEHHPVVQDLNEFFVGNIKCTRYCIEKKTAEVSERGTYRLLNLVWTFASGENETASVSTPITGNVLKPDVTRKNVFPSKNSTSARKRCELYLVVDCNIPRNRESSLNNEEKKFIEDLYPSFKGFTNTFGQSDKSHEILVEKRNVTRTTETKFHVKNSVESLSIIILGNISKVDLEIPTVDQETTLGWDETTEISDLMLSLTRMTETMGVRLNARSPPSGGWCLKLTPVKGSNYRFIIVTMLNDSLTEDRNHFKRDESTKDESKENRFLKEEIVAESRYSQKIVEKPVTYKTNESNAENGNRSSDKFSSRIFELDSSENQARHWKIPDEANEKWLSFSNLFNVPQVFVLPSKDQNNKESSQATNLNSRIAVPEIQYMDAENNLNPFTKIMMGPEMENRKNHESLELDDLARDSTDNFLRKKIATIDVSADSSLVVRAGAGIVRILFDIKNNQMLNTLICYKTSSSPLRPIEIYLPNPIGGRYCNAVSPGQIVTVAVEILVPRGISDTVNSVTLTATVLGFKSYQTIEKTANLYIQSSNARKVDDTRPTINYYFNNNCGGHLREDRCSKTIWSVDITVQDVDSGLKLVTSSPSGIEARSEFVSGTTNQVTFFYYATCCHQTVDISAVDMYGNYNNRRIDVTEWDNLADGEIAAIVIGVLFLILLLILIILSVVYCVKTRQSRDLPYTQRYGSRPPAQRPERTSF